MIQKIPEPDGREHQERRRGRRGAASGEQAVPDTSETPDDDVEESAAEDPAMLEPGDPETVLADRGLPAVASGEAAKETDVATETDVAERIDVERDDADRDDDAEGDDEPEPQPQPDEPAPRASEVADEATDAADEAASDDAEPAEAAENPQLRDTARPLDLRLEAVLFGSGQALSAVRLGKVLDEPFELVKEALDQLAARWAESRSALELVEIAGGWRFMTRPDYQPDLAGLARKSKQEKLSPAALETLAVVAYRQPIGRADIESVRGVAAGPLLRVLLDRDLIRITGRSSEPGHPLLYGTTRRFLDHFGLRSLKSLPDIKDLLAVS